LPLEQGYSINERQARRLCYILYRFQWFSVQSWAIGGAGLADTVFVLPIVNSKTRPDSHLPQSQYSRVNVCESYLYSVVSAMI